MSRYYEMTVTIRGNDPAKTEAIYDAATEEWEFCDCRDDGAELCLRGGDYLYGGEGTEQFAERLATAVWKANRGYCVVEVKATWMDDLPCDFYCLDEDDYQQLTGKLGEKTE